MASLTQKPIKSAGSPKNMARWMQQQTPEVLLLVMSQRGIKVTTYAKQILQKIYYIEWDFISFVISTSV